MSGDRDIDRRVWKLFDGYVHGTISRREFLDRAAKFTATGVSAATLLATLSPDYSLAQQVDPDAEQAGAIKASLMLNHGELDERVNASWPEFERGLKKARVNYVHHDYEGA